MFRLDVTLRNCDELAAQEAEIDRLNKVLIAKEAEIGRMGMFAAQNIEFVDQLKRAKNLLDSAGLDSSFINVGRGR